MTALREHIRPETGEGPDQTADDIAALVHFSAYIAREARRLGHPNAAETARMLERELLSLLENA